MTQTIDETKLEQLMGQMVGHMTGAALCFGVWLGDELGLYRALTEVGTATADELADRVGCNRRLVREWLDGQVAGGLLTWDRDSRPLRDHARSHHGARRRRVTGVRRPRDERHRLRVHRPAQGHRRVPWRRRPQLGRPPPVPVQRYRVVLPHRLPRRAPELDRGARRCRRHARDGGTVADVGCGHGASAVVLAQQFPAAHITGFDFHQPSIDTARERADEAGVGDSHLRPRRREELLGHLDLICFFDCLHDMGDPVGIARYAREHLNDDGTVLLVEPFAIDGRADNIDHNPMAAMLYTVSSSICTPNSLSQEVGLGLGAQAGEAQLRQVFEEAGFTPFRRAAETPLNLILEAKQ